MLSITTMITTLKSFGINAYYGVPDSQLRALCDYVTDEFGVNTNHVIAANEGGAIGLAAGHYLATGKPALVYMQNSGLGNAVNPICSLLEPYKIPALFIVGWRGEPGIKDEPQHEMQGAITLELLSLLGIKYCIIDAETDDAAFVDEIAPFIEQELAASRRVALVISKGCLLSSIKCEYTHQGNLTREQAVRCVIDCLPESAVVVSTTGKLSRELFEIRENGHMGHGRDFLTVGSMGHASMIALGIAKEQPKRSVIILDGDGAAIMHMGALAILAANKPCNITHIVFDNGAHDSVGGMPTASSSIDYCALARSVDYRNANRVASEEELRMIVPRLTSSFEGPSFLTIDINLLSRSNLGRPTSTPTENRDAFMSFLQNRTRL